SDFCVESKVQRQGIGTTMLSQLSEYASTKDVDFIILVSDLERFYVANGYQRLNSLSSWLRVHEHKNYGIVV
ncbi:GNAT family N-acetyltransferase, partial [Vibrio parahaemolyticus]|nr:GNAT family N-acetyltransferase [Vibrio parahaemolyticus]